MQDTTTPTVRPPSATGAASSEDREAGLSTGDVSSIFLVDDEPTVLESLARVIRRAGHPVQTFQDPREALARLLEDGPHLLLTDLQMPGMNGIELARSALEADPHLAVIILTGAGDVPTAAESLRLGVQDYLTKPVDHHQLEASIGRALRERALAGYRHEAEAWMRAEVAQRTEEALRQAQELKRVTVGVLASLVRTLEARMPYLKGHSERVSRCSARVAKQLDLPAKDAEEIRVAGLLHDIGMVATPDDVLRKRGELTEEEYAALKDHVQVGAQIVAPLTHLAPVVDYVLYHHERLNGSGYPAGLRGEEIPVGAQIVGVAESYVSLTEERSFRAATSPAEALEMLRGTEGVWFSGRLLDALADVVSREGEEDS